MNNLYYNNKKLKSIKKKRTQKTKKVWGWILTVIGALELPATISAMSYGNFGDLATCLLFLVPGLALLFMAKRQVDRWDRYEAIIDNRGNTPISLIAKKMNLPEQQVLTDLQTMIHSDFFIGPNYNIEAYIDAERDLLVMASGGEPLKPLPDLPEKDDQSTSHAYDRPKAGQAAGRGSTMRGSTGAAGSAANGGDAGARGKDPRQAFGGGASKGTASSGGASGGSDAPDAAFTSIFDGEPADDEELTELELIQQAIADTPDDEVRGYLYGLEGSVRRIGQRLETRPELMEKVSIKRLYKYYLPQILELIRKYHAPDTPADLKAQIREALATSADALSNIEADLLERDQMDAEVDIEVLKNMFAQDGLLGRGGRTGTSGTGATPAAEARATGRAGAPQQAGASQARAQ